MVSRMGIRLTAIANFAWCLTIAFLVLLPGGGRLFAQGARSSLSGVVKDTDGGVLPGVEVAVKDPTGTELKTITNERGVFSVPSIPPGTYSVTLSLPGF